MTDEYIIDLAARCGSFEQNRQSFPRVAVTSANGARLDRDASVGVIALQRTDRARSADIRRRPRRHRVGPQGFLSAAQIAQRADAPLSSVYHWLKTGRLGKPHRWRNLLVVSEQAADEFLLAVRPLEGSGAEGGADA